MHIETTGSLTRETDLLIELNIPGLDLIQLEHLVCDVNGTLAVDGSLIEGVGRRLRSLRDRFEVHLLTANTYGRQELIDRQLGLTATRLQAGDESAQKAAFVRQLGSRRVVAIGQGANDAGMLKEAVLGICVLSPEGTAVGALLSADLVVPDIQAALDLLEKPLRLVTTLRK
jgi:P-type E1-E2 ATPase